MLNFISGMVMVGVLALIFAATLGVDIKLETQVCVMIVSLTSIVSLVLLAHFKIKAGSTKAEKPSIELDLYHKLVREVRKQAATRLCLMRQKLTRLKDTSGEMYKFALSRLDERDADITRLATDLNDTNIGKINITVFFLFQVKFPAITVRFVAPSFEALKRFKSGKSSFVFV